MPDPALGRARLVAQGLVNPSRRRPTDAVMDFVAMQGQDLPGVMASAALRTTGRAVADVIADLDAGLLVRGYPMRGTVFLMAAQDLLWVSQLCNAAMLRAAQRRRGHLELTDDIVERALGHALDVLEDQPRGLSRADLFAAWGQLGIPVDAGRGYHQLAHFVGMGALAYGPWNGSDQNVVLAASWLPAGSDLETRFNGDRIAATAEMLRRYLTSHGPASVQDFAWWTKLPMKEIRAAFTLVADQFEAGEWPGAGDGETRYWRPGLAEEVAAQSRQLKQPLLLPGFDEFILGYRDRLFAMTEEQHQLLVPGNNGVFGRSLVVDGTVRGLWKRAGRPGRRSLELVEFAPLAATMRARVERRFLDFPWVTD